MRRIIHRTNCRPAGSGVSVSPPARHRVLFREAFVCRGRYATRKAAECQAGREDEFMERRQCAGKRMRIWDRIRPCQNGSFDDASDKWLVGHAMSVKRIHD